MTELSQPEHLACISDCGRYRYTLERETGVLGGEGTVLFVMLNPSTADDCEDDPTIRRCLDFARQWGYGRLMVGNLYAWRATDPRELFKAPEPVGVENDDHLTRLARIAREAIFAWGATPHPYLGRAERVAHLVEFYVEARCLGQTKELHPRHPLYLRADSKRVPVKRSAVRR